MTERVIDAVPEPAKDLLDTEDIFELNQNSTNSCFRRGPKWIIKHKTLREHFKREGRLTNLAVLAILDQATRILESERNVIRIKSPVTIVGDIHGQYFDLLKLLQMSGKVKDTKYLFLGDYVDRGCFSMECVLYLYALKISYPRNIHLLRGNHECRHLAEHFTFKQECFIKYNAEVYEACMKSFDALPLAAVVNEQLFCVHAGLSPTIKLIDDIELINRFQEPPKSGPMCDLLWSDPSVKFDKPGFAPNLARGCSFSYSYDSVVKFLKRNGLLAIVRAHEAQADGYKLYRKHEGFPCLITIFSAPNYLDCYGNKGAVLVYGMKNNLEFHQIKAAPHPFWLPNFANVITWSLPFIGEKLTQLLESMLITALQDDDANARRTIMAQKVRAVAKLATFYQRQREENETILKLKGLSTDGLVGIDDIVDDSVRKSAAGRKSIRSNCFDTGFEQAKMFDLINERMPEDPPPESTNASTVDMTYTLEQVLFR